MPKSLIHNFTSGPLAPQLLRFALPLFLSNLLQVVYNMVDMAVVGRVLGNPGLSAVSIGGDVIGFLTFVAIGFSNAGQVTIARLIGAGKQEKIGRFIGTMASFLLLCAVCISILALAFQDKILHLMNTPAAAYTGAKSYANICMSGLVFTYGYNAIAAVLRGMGDSRRPFLCIALASVLNLALDVLFVILLDLGAGGAALATVISQAVSFLTCGAILLRRRRELGLELKAATFLQPDRAMLTDFLLLGTPMALKSASIHISKLFVNSWINSYSLAVSAFAGIANKVSGIANLVSTAMNTSGATLVGQNIAAGKYSRVHRVLLLLSAITLSTAAVCSLLLCLFPQQIFSFFTNNPADRAAIAEIAGGYIPIAVLMFAAAALRSAMNALINGSGHHKINFLTAFLDGIVMRIGLSVLFGLVLDMKHYGFWLGDALAGFTPFLIGFVFYLTGKWKKPAT